MLSATKENIWTYQLLPIWWIIPKLGQFAENNSLGNGILFVRWNIDCLKPRVDCTIHRNKFSWKLLRDMNVKVKREFSVGINKGRCWNYMFKVLLWKKYILVFMLRKSSKCPKLYSSFRAWKFHKICTYYNYLKLKLGFWLISHPSTNIKRCP